MKVRIGNVSRETITALGDIPMSSTPPTEGLGYQFPESTDEPGGHEAVLEALREVAVLIDPAVIIETRGGVIQNEIVPDGIALRIVDWDDLPRIKCPECGDTTIWVDASTADDWFICNGCNHNFFYREPQATTKE
jgi:hypothetical protein